MTTIKAYTDLEQSKVLATILLIESADMCWGLDNETLHYNNSPYPCAWKDYSCKEYYIPCWSLAALLDVLPPIEGFKPIIDLDINQIRYEGKHRDELIVNNENLIDACVTMIEKLNELKIL